jgi:glycosyltransferase involved in cell wall biosynthesis
LVRGPWRKFIYPLRKFGSSFLNKQKSYLLRDQRDSIWHSTYYTIPNSWLGPQVVTVHDLIQELFPDIYCYPEDEKARALKQSCIENADIIICDSESTRKDILRAYSSIKGSLSVIYLACSPVFQPLPQNMSPTILDNEDFLLFIGNRTQYKNFHGLLEVYEHWEGRNHTRLVVVGAPFSSIEKRLIDEKGLTNRIQLFSEVSDAYLCNLYNQAKAFIFPSIYEGFGIPILEALACGCPVVASRIPSSEEVGGNCLFYFDISNPNEFTTAINQAILNGHDPVRVQRGLDRTKFFSWDKTAQKTLEAYRSISRI